MNTIRKRQDLYDGDERLGYTTTSYNLKVIEEFEEMTYNLSAATNRPIIYLLTVTQRIIYFNKGSIQKPLSKDTDEYRDYPVLLNAQLNIQVQNGIDVSILDYSPKVINTEINKSESNNDAQGETTGTTKSSTTGTTISANIGVGASQNMGAHIDGGLSASHEWSTTDTEEHLKTTNKDHSLGFSMAVQDWGSYASINTLQDSQKGITWNFGQQNPWNALTFNKSCSDTLMDNEQVQLAIPDYISKKLKDNKTILPPSGLSLNGFDFMMESTFLLKISQPLLESFQVEHLYKLGKATHRLTNDTVEVFRDKILWPLTSKEGPAELSLKTEIFPSLLSLKPIGEVFNSAIVGFYRKSFDLSPSDSTGFKIRSFENDLLIKSPEIDGNPIDSSYSLLQNVLCLTLRENEISFDIFFKINDLHKNYNLIIKHWIQDKQGSPNHTGVSLRFMINEDEDCTIVKQVNDKLQEGGESNILSLSLRNLDYTTIDFHNYLKIGLNKISVFAKKPENCEEIRYLINAISVVSSN